MNLLYLEHYPHFTGTVNAKVSIDALFVLLVLTIAADGDKDTAYDATELIEKIGDKTFAFDNILYDAEEAALWLKDLAELGWCAAMWEEGTHAICLPEFKSQAVKGMRKAMREGVEEEDFP